MMVIGMQIAPGCASRRVVWLAALLVLLAIAPSDVSAQLKIDTVGVLPPAPLTRSVILGDRLPTLQAQWQAPLNDYQRLWVKTINGRADGAPSAGAPADFAAAALDASIAQAAGLRYAMTGAVADLQKCASALANAALPRRNENDFITFSEILTSYLAAYDFIRAAPEKDLPAEKRTEIETRLLTLARSLTNGNGTASNAMGKNGATRALAGLLLNDQKLLDTGLGNLQTHYNYSTTDDGWFTDSQSIYLNYTLRHLALFARAYQQASNKNIYPAVQPLLDLSLALRKPDGTVPNVSNGVNWPVATHLFTSMPDKAKAQWMLWNLKQLPVDGFADTNLENNDYSLCTFFALTNFDVGAAAPTQSPTYLATGQSAVTVFRNDWTKNSDYLFLSPGIDSAALLPGTPLARAAFHSHNDTGEILLAAKGHYLLVAAGYDRPDLSNAPPGFAPQDPANHNVVLVDGALGAKNEGRMMRPERFTHTDRLDATERGNFRGASDFATLKMKYGGTDVSRSVAFTNEDYFVVVDRMQSAESHAYGFNLIGRGALTTLTIAPNLVEVMWQHGGFQAVEHLTSAAPMTLKTDSTFMQDTFNKYEPTQRMNATVTAENAVFLSVIETDVAGGLPKLTVTDASNAECAAQQVKSVAGDFEDWIISQPSQKMRMIGPSLLIDAEYCYVRLVRGAVESAMLARGALLNLGNRTLFRTDNPLTVSLVFGDTTLQATISADGFTPGTRLESLRRIASATLNGQPLELTNEKGLAYLALSEPGELRIAYTSSERASPLLLWGLGAATIGVAIAGAIYLAVQILRRRE